MIDSGLKELESEDNSDSDISSETTTNNKSEDEIIAEYLRERSKSRAEILASLRENNANEGQEYQELTSEELQEILN